MSAAASVLDDRSQVTLTSRPRARRRRRKQELPPLFDGQHITCPRCRKKLPLLDIETLSEMPAYERETVPVYRHRSLTLSPDHDDYGCGFVFALRSDPVQRRNR